MADKIKDKDNYVLKSVVSTSLNMLLSMLTKVVNFIFNMLLLRIISKESYGLSKIYLEFVFLVLLFFPRETIRKSCQKYSAGGTEEEENKKIVEATQLCWKINLGVIFISIPVFFLFLFFAPILRDYKIHLAIYTLAANIELMSEPVIINMNLRLEDRLKMFSFTISNYTRIISNYVIALVFVAYGWDLWSFTISRILASTAYISYLYYVAIFKLNYGRDVLVPNYDFKNFFSLNPKLKEIFISFCKTTGLKMILTYTEKTILSFVLHQSEEEKGEYSFVVDNFAILVRYFLEPVEESFFNLTNKIKSSEVNKEQYIKNTNLKKVFIAFLRFMMIFGIIISLYVFVLGKDVVIVLYTDKWSNPSTILILKTYSIYLGIIAVNGVIESFANATFGSEEMGIFRQYMIFNSLMLIFLSNYLTKESINGLIIANGICMLFRIGVNCYLILTWRELKDTVKEKLDEYVFIKVIRNTINFFREAFIKYISIITTLLCVSSIYLIRNYLFGENEKRMIMLGCSGVFFVINVYVIYKQEKDEFADILKSKKD